MRKLAVVCSTVMLLVFCMGASGELDNYTVGGYERIRIQDMFSSGFDDDGGDDFFTEALTRVNILAEFSSDVSLFIELQSYNILGEDFLSTTSTAFGGFEVNEIGNGRGRDGGDVDLYQAYINMGDAFGYDGLNIRFGRQELQFGRDVRTGRYTEFVIGNNDTNQFFSGMSFDALRLTYDTDVVTYDVIWAKLAELRSIEQDADTDLVGLYISYKGLENNLIDVYWLFVRDAEDPFGVSTSAFIGQPSGGDNDKLHTFGARINGVWNQLDYNLEGAFQAGEAENGLNRDGDYEGWAVDFEAGWTFENVQWEPRVHIGVAYLSGDDDLTDDDVEAFNRVFSDKEYGTLIDGGELSNALVIRLGVDAQPTEKVGLGLEYLFFQADEDDVKLINTIDFFGIPLLAIPTEIETDEDLGHEIDAYVSYAYSEDLSFKFGYSHFFTEDGIEEGTLSTGNGQFAFAATDDDDLDYVYVEAELRF